LQDKRINATSGVLESKGKATGRLLAIGSAFFRIGSQDGVLIQEDRVPVVSVDIADDKLYVSTTIRDGAGEVVAELKRNEWHLNRKNYFDRNYTDQALEVVDHSGRIILQVVNFGDVIHFAGVLYRKDGSPVSLVPLPSGGALLEFPKDVEKHHEIPRLFDYPSERHLGSCGSLSSLRRFITEARNMPGHNVYYVEGALDIGRRRSPVTERNGVRRASPQNTN